MNVYNFGRVLSHHQKFDSMTKKVLRLDFESELDFLLVGIVSGHKDYRICYELNSILKIRMSRQPDIELSAGRPGSRTIHSCYHYSRGEHEAYHLVSNKDIEGTGNFIPEIKNIDYFLII